MVEKTDSSFPEFTLGDGVPFVYFDVVAAQGTLGGAVQIELASRVITPSGPGVEVRFAISGHLRCSPAAAVALRNAIDNSLQMLEQSEAPQQAVTDTIN